MNGIGLTKRVVDPALHGEIREEVVEPHVGEAQEVGDLDGRGVLRAHVAELAAETTEGRLRFTREVVGVVEAVVLDRTRDEAASEERVVGTPTVCRLQPIEERVEGPDRGAARVVRLLDLAALRRDATRSRLDLVDR